MHQLTKEQYNSFLFYLIFTCPEEQINEALKRFHKRYSV